MYHELTVVQFTKMLTSLKACFDKAAAHASARKFDADQFAAARLAPDMFPFARQVQIACDTAKLGVSRLTGVEAPSHADTEKSLDELRARIDSTIAWLATVPPEAFAETAERHVSQPRWNGKWMTGHDFLVQHVLPNFYFHVSTAYGLLRHSGVDVGKRDYLGPMPMKD